MLDALQLHVRQILLVQIIGGAAADVVDPDDLRGNAYGGGVGGQVVEHHAACSHTDVISDEHRTQHLGSGTDQYVVANGRMPLAGVLAGTAQGHAVIDGAVIADLGGFAEHDPHAVVNEQPLTDLGPRMNLDTRKVTGNLADQAGQEQQFVPIQPMGDPVGHQHMKSRIQQNHFQHIARCGVLVPYILCICPKALAAYLFSCKFANGITIPYFREKGNGIPFRAWGNML